jgi:hypothetical protein
MTRAWQGGDRVKISMSIKALLFAASGVGAAGLAAGLTLGRAGAQGIPSVDPLHYSGILVDKSTGAPVNGSRAITLSLWDSETATTADHQKCVSRPPQETPVTNGRFRIALDLSCLTAVHQNKDLWVEVIVGTDSLGRRKVGAAPFAVEADSADSAKGASGGLEQRLKKLENRLQSGSGITDGAGSATVAFAPAFPATPRIVAQANAPGVLLDVINKSATGFTVVARNVMGFNTGATDLGQHTHPMSRTEGDLGLVCGPARSGTCMGRAIGVWEDSAARYSVQVEAAPLGSHTHSVSAPAAANLAFDWIALAP